MQFRTKKWLYLLLVFMLGVVMVMGLTGTIAAAADGAGTENVTSDNTTSGGGGSDNTTSDNTTYGGGGSDNTTGGVTDNTTSDNTSGGFREGRRIPPGQLVRRGLSGPIVGVGDGYVLIETVFGVVKVYTDEDVDESMIGRRVAVKLGKTEGGASGIAHGSDNTTGGTDNTSGSTDNSSGYYRVATAEQFKLIPGRGSIKHHWGTFEPTDAGCSFVDDEGNTFDAECSDEEEVVGLLATGYNSTDNFTPQLLGIEKTSKIRYRIEARLAEAQDEGDSKALDRIQSQLARLEEKQAERLARAEERAAAGKGKGNGGGKGNQGNHGGGGQGKNK